MFVSQSLFREYVRDNRTLELCSIVRQMYIEYGQKRTDEWMRTKLALLEGLDAGWWKVFVEIAAPSMWEQALEFRDNQARLKPQHVVSTDICPWCHRKYKEHGVDKRTERLVVLCGPTKFGVVVTPAKGKPGGKDASGF